MALRIKKNRYLVWVISQFKFEPSAISCSVTKLSIFIISTKSNLSIFASKHDLLDIHYQNKNNWSEIAWKYRTKLRRREELPAKMLVALCLNKVPCFIMSLYLPCLGLKKHTRDLTEVNAAITSDCLAYICMKMRTGQPVRLMETPTAPW